MKSCKELLSIDAHEANYVANIYNLLRKEGLEACQISLETYFDFARVNSAMPKRPDITLFDSGFDGLFNLYKDGNKDTPNDIHKIKFLNTLIEIKGSESLNAKNEKARFDAYSADIDKLKKWQELISQKTKKKIQTCFIAVDTNDKPLSNGLIEELFSIADCLVVYITKNDIFIKQSREIE